MRLLIDSDAFSKLGAAGLLQEAAKVLGVPWSECHRLAALPYMLKKGRFAKKLGPSLCAELLPLAEQLLVVPAGPAELVETLTAIPGIDPGEALLFAAAANSKDLLLSGDKRALRSVKEVPGLAERLKRRVVTLEAILLALCTKMGDDHLRSMVGPVLSLDTVIRIAFLDARPAEGLKSYFDAQAKEVAPLVLWSL
jgi:hypothetical protein